MKKQAWETIISEIKCMRALISKCQILSWKCIRIAAKSVVGWSSRATKGGKLQATLKKSEIPSYSCLSPCISASNVKSVKRSNCCQYTSASYTNSLGNHWQIIDILCRVCILHLRCINLTGVAAKL